jgi:hypothetical protein
LSDPNTLTFSLLPETLAVASQTDNSALTHFNFDSNLMQIPLLAVTGSGDARFGVDLTLLSSDFQFGVKLDSLVSR